MDQNLHAGGLRQQGQGMARHGGSARALAFLRSVSAGAGLMFGAVFVGELALPHDMKPSTVLGRFHGNTETAEIEAARDAKVRLERELAEAHAAPPATWQMEQQLNQAQMQATQQALETQAGIANLADAACVTGGILGGLFGDDPTMKQWGDALQKGCGVGDQVRSNMNDQLAGAARNGSGVVRRSEP